MACKITTAVHFVREPSCGTEICQDHIAGDPVEDILNAVPTPGILANVQLPRDSAEDLPGRVRPGRTRPVGDVPISVHWPPAAQDAPLFPQPRI